jgi:hypothetical protein
MVDGLHRLTSNRAKKSLAIALSGAEGWANGERQWG